MVTSPNIDMFLAILGMHTTTTRRDAPDANRISQLCHAFSNLTNVIYDHDTASMYVCSSNNQL